MAYIKIYNKNLQPIGVLNTANISAVEGGERYVIAKNAKMIPCGAINIDNIEEGTSLSSYTTVYDNNLMPIGVANTSDLFSEYYDNSSIGSFDDDQGSGTE